MLALTDPRWATLQGGYHVPFDASLALRAIEKNWTDDTAWEQLWEELHHQGDLGEASYAAVPVLVTLAASAVARDWQLYALAATIETERHRAGNVPMPAWLAADYTSAWQRLTTLALGDLAGARDASLIRSALAVVAIGRGQRLLGAFIGWLDESELDELADDRLGWSESYFAPAEPPIG
jgi:hypothetical protein